MRPTNPRDGSRRTNLCEKDSHTDRQRVARIERSEIRGKRVRLKGRSRVSLRSTQATILVMPAHSRSKNGVASLAYVAGIHVF